MLKGKYRPINYTWFSSEIMPWAITTIIARFISVFIAFCTFYYVKICN